MKKLVLCLVIIFSLISCNSDDDESVNCDLFPNEGVSLQFIAAATGEDVLSNGTFSIDDLEIINTSTQEDIVFTTSTNLQGDTIVIIPNPTIENSQTFTYTVRLANDLDFNFMYDFVYNDVDCGFDFRFENFQFDDEITFQILDGAVTNAVVITL